MRLLITLFFFGAVLVAGPVFSQHEGHHTQEEEKKPVEPEHGMHHSEMSPASMFLTQQASGTAISPASAHLHVTTFEWKGWQSMLHGIFSLNAIQQTGPRGRNRVFSTNWAMLMSHKELDSKSSLMFRTMLSLEPATVSDRQYPLLFQTGETAYGEAIVDGQHPHDLFMELSGQYAVELGEKTILNLYGALVGDPALGPIAFPHRISALELPQATLSHHLQDSTHIANDVITIGLSRPLFRIEGSAFHGAEPDEGRWDIDFGALDSWAARVSFTPNKNWVGQFSIGRLEEPEAIHPGDLVRTTASATYHKPLQNGMFAGSFIWGKNHLIVEDLDLHSFLLEGVYQFNRYNYFTARFENVEKNELFPEEEHHDVFRINSLTIGYTRDFDILPDYKFGLGANFTLYSFPSEIETSYGENPYGFLLYFRIRYDGGSH